MAYTTKLLSPVNGYSVFETNQVLTADHLNSISNYFDYHQRLTRARLLGAGIVCGLELVFTKNSIGVSAGVGVTSDGDLLTVEKEVNFSGMLPFENKNAGYPLFSKISDGNTETRLWELVKEDRSSVSGFIKTTDFFNGKSASDFVALLYADQYIKDTDNCSGEDCDGKADMFTNEIKVILLHKNDHDKTINKRIFDHSSYFKMPDVAIPRVLLNENESIFSYADLVAGYAAAISSGADALQEPLKIASDVVSLLQECWTTCQPGAQIISEAQLKTAPALAGFIKKALAEKSTGIQYVHDYLKDVWVAYEEFKESVFELSYGCCINPEAFAKHLALGLLQDDGGFQNARFRNLFIGSPLINNNETRLEDALRLFARLADIVMSFALPVSAEIKVTPSGQIDQPLQKRAIPYYYKSDTIWQNWNPEKARRGRSNTNLSYFAGHYSALPHVAEPLKYELDQYPFFRVEGHVGKTFAVAYSTLNNLRRQYDLPFDIVGVQLQKEKILWPPVRPVRPGILDILFEKEKFLFQNKLDHVVKYNDQLMKSLPDEVELSQDAITKEYGDPIALRKTVVDKKVELDSHIAVLKTELARPAVETIGKVSWDNIHVSMANAGAQINKNAKLFTAAAYRSPLENLAVIEQPKTLQWIGDLIISRGDKIQEGYIFKNFLKENPSMLHNAGVCRGGTLVLVYDTTNNVSTVVADFYLPYIAKEELIDTKVDPAIVPKFPLPAIDFTISKDIIKKPILNKDIFNIKNDLNKAELVKNELNLRIDQRLNEFDGRINNVRGEVVANGLNISKAVDGVKEKYENSFSRLMSSYDTVITKNISKPGVATDNTHASFDDMILGVRTEFATRIDKAEMNFDSKLGAIKNDIGVTGSQVKNALDGIGNLNSKLEATKTDLTNNIANVVSGIEGRVKQLQSGYDQKIGALSNEIENKIGASESRLTQKIENNSKEIDGKILATKNDAIAIANTNTVNRINAQSLEVDKKFSTIDSTLKRNNIINR